MTPAADPAAMRLHLDMLFTGQKGLIELVSEDADHKLNINGRFVPDDEGIGAAVEFAADLTEHGRRVYVGAGLRRSDLAHDKRSTNADIIAWPAMVWDFDNQEAAVRGLKVAEDLGVPFHLVVQTGALSFGKPDLRVQCWTLLAEPLTDMGAVTRLLKEGIAVLGSDKSINDPRRVMRLAGSVAWARKDGRADEPTSIPYEHMSFAR